MKERTILSFAKINLSIDVGPRKENGYHDVDMVMQSLSFHDDIKVTYEPFSENDPAREENSGKGFFDIKASTDRFYIPTDRRNLAYQAAELMGARYGKDIASGRVEVDIKKRIPVAGGLAGGSGNAGAVIHALNLIWDLGLSLDELASAGAEIGSDVPFCIYSGARGNKNLPESIRSDSKASPCMRATGRGTLLESVTPLRSWVVIAKPRLSISTKEVYAGIDSKEVTERPDNERLVASLAKEDRKASYRDFINVLEEYTLAEYPEVKKLKELVKESGAEVSLMSGSGPTVFGIFGDIKSAMKASDSLRKKGYESYWTRTII